VKSPRVFKRFTQTAIGAYGNLPDLTAERLQSVQNKKSTAEFAIILQLATAFALISAHFSGFGLSLAPNFGENRPLVAKHDTGILV